METLIKLRWLLIAAPIIFILAKSIYKYRWFRLLIIFLHAVLLTYLTIFLFNKPSWRWSGQNEMIKEFSKSNDKRAFEFIKNNFLLIDNSFDKTLLPNPEGDVDDSTSLVVTNRKSLISFFRMLNENLFDIDLVVFDIGLATKTGDDSTLRNEMLKLYARNKILLSIDPQNKENNNLITNESVYGNISEEGNEKLFTSHRIKKDEYYSLSYKLYSNYDKVNIGKSFFCNELFFEKDSTGHSYLAMNTFFPEFTITDEDLLKSFEHNARSTLNPDIDSGYEKSSRIYYFLSQPLSDYGKIEFLNNLKQRKEAGQKNIVFIAAFASQYEDMHQTLYGNLHGSTILLNIFYALHQKKHYLSFWFIFLLFIGYFLISCVLVYHCLKITGVRPEPNYNKQKKGFAKVLLIKLVSIPSIFKQRLQEFETFMGRKKVSKYVYNLFSFLFDFIFWEELAFTILIILVLLVKATTGHLLNFLSLLIYLTIVKLSLAYLGKK